eukprot:CAMPEP_0184408286 /NCGR_PEP_ID=MMETSP0738-20130409/3110_1 /TAXON_ID=385413 /ORGANISM="Thalassiosira miniscula, Strain CCMP1093" /LENGTH=91 /DNA_ID=CAMNT_0026765687 /DNA_START=50 /DNA_END=325 /DNA_ORIENTATION=+
MTPFTLSAAGFRLAGYLLETNLRVAQEFGRAALLANPFVLSKGTAYKPAASKAPVARKPVAAKPVAAKPVAKKAAPSVADKVADKPAAPER